VADTAFFVSWYSKYKSTVMKRIITCSDGTWNKPEEKDDGIISPTNVYKFYDLIAEHGNDGVQQSFFYDRGIGTRWYDRFVGGMFGVGINKNIIDAYVFIAEQYEPGDEIYLVGFSRGAYTARSVAGFIRNSGILRPAYLDDKLCEAFKLYRRRDEQSHPDGEEAQAFKKAYCYDTVQIKFIGVWDTVGELGIPIQGLYNFNMNILNCRFHDVKLSSYVDYAYHAVAIDERRKPFMPTLWEQTEKARQKGQIMEQMWFPGVHSDVGGSYKEDGLSDCTLLWMIEKAKQVGLQFKDCGGITPRPLEEMHNSMKLMYKLLSKGVNRDIKMTPEYNGIISQAAKDRWNADVCDYRLKANPNLRTLIG
jgi:uncharacterized protein (DUF2235 family)